MYLSVVIPTYHDSHCLALTLDSLARQSLPANRFEVVVVGDGDTADDALVKTIGALGYRYLGLAEHVGRAAARNRGIAEARGDVLVFLDSDSYAAPDLLARHADHHAGGGCAVVLGKRWEIGWPELRGILTASTIDPAGFPAEVGDLRFPASLDAAAVAELMQTPWLFTYTNNVSVRRDLVEAIGGFDEAYGTRWGFEDLDLFYRVYLALDGDSGAFRYDPDASCCHLPHHRSASGMREDYWVNMTRAREKYPTYEWEFTGLLEPPLAAARIRRYRAALAASRPEPTCQAGPVWRRVADLLDVPADAKLLVIGLGAAGLGGSVATLDPTRPAGDGNLPLLGHATGFSDGEFDLVVNLNLWRWSGVHDLCRQVEESLRIAATSVLVYSTDFTLPEHLGGVHDLDYVVDTLAAHLAVTVRTNGTDTVVTLRMVAR